MAQEQQTHRGSHRQRNNQRHENRNHIGRAERSEQLSRETFQEEDGQKREHHDEAGIDHGAADFERSGQDDIEHRARIGQRPILVKSSQHILHVHDRVIDDFAQRDRQSAEGHRIQRSPASQQHEDRPQQRERDRRQADEHHAPVVQEGDQNDGHEHAAEHQGRTEIADRSLNERGLTKQGGMQRDTRRERGLKFLQRRLDRCRDRQRVEIRLFVNDEQYATTAIDCRTPHAIGGTETHIGHMPQRQRDAVANRDRHRRQIVRSFQPRALPNRQTLIGRLDETRAPEARRTARRRQHFVQSDAVLLQAIRRDEDLILLHIAAEDLDVRHAGHGLQSTPERPVRQRSQLLAGHFVVGRQSHHQQAARRGREGHQARRLGDLGKLLPHLGQPLAHELSRGEDVRPLLEDRRHDRQSRDRR